MYTPSNSKSYHNWLLMGFVLCKQCFSVIRWKMKYFNRVVFAWYQTKSVKFRVNHASWIQRDLKINNTHPNKNRLLVLFNYVLFIYLDMKMWLENYESFKILRLLCIRVNFQKPQKHKKNSFYRNQTIRFSHGM